MNRPHIVPAAGSHAQAAAELIYHTDPGVWDFLFDGNTRAYRRFAAGLWERPGNNFSHSESVVALLDEGQPLALEMGYTGAVEAGLRGAMNRAAMSFMPGDELTPLLERAADIDYLTPYLPPRRVLSALPVGA